MSSHDIFNIVWPPENPLAAPREKVWGKALGSLSHLPASWHSLALGGCRLKGQRTPVGVSHLSNSSRGQSPQMGYRMLQASTRMLGTPRKRTQCCQAMKRLAAPGQHFGASAYYLFIWLSNAQGRRPVPIGHEPKVVSRLSYADQIHNIQAASTQSVAVSRDFSSTCSTCARNTHFTRLCNLPMFQIRIMHHYAMKVALSLFGLIWLMKWGPT